MVEELLEKLILSLRRFSLTLCNLNVHHRVHISSSLKPILS